MNNLLKKIFFIFSFFISPYAIEANFASIEQIKTKIFTCNYKKNTLPSFFNGSNTLYNEFTEKHILPEFFEKEHAYYKNDDQESLGQAVDEKLRWLNAYTLQNRTVNATTVASDAETYHEIGIDTLMKKISTHLSVGKSSLTVHTCSPTTDNDVIQNAQSAQQFFENNREIKEKLGLILDLAAPGERALLDLWNKDKMNNATTTIKDYKAPLSFLEEHASAGNIKSIGAPLFAPMQILLNPFLSHCLTGLYDSDSTSAVYEPLKQLLKEGTHNLLYNGTLTSAAIQNLKKSFSSETKNTHKKLFYLASGTLLIFGACIDHKDYSAIQSVCLIGGSSLAITIAAHDLYEKRTSKEETTVHQSLIDAANYMRSAEKIYQEMGNNSPLKSQFPHFCPTYEAVRDGKETQSIVRDLLETNTFTGAPAIFSNVGRIALVSERLIKAKEELVPLMTEMGELDKYLSLVAYKEIHSSSTPIIYTQPTASKKACINAKNFVSPAIPKSNPNSFVIGDDKHSVVVITGPNGRGKSFVAKAAMANVVTTETLGFACAEKLKISPINEIRYVANVKDEAGVESRYQAEVRKMGELFKRQKTASAENRTVFSVSDEPLSATNAKGGTKGLENMLRRSNEIKNNKNLTVIITHHAIEDKDYIKHYHVKENEKFVYFPGRSDNDSNAEQLLNQALDKIDKEIN